MRKRSRDYFQRQFEPVGFLGVDRELQVMRFRGLREFQENWQRPFQAAFSDKVAIDEARIFDGEWGACFGAQHAVHSGEFMGVPATGKRVTIRYMDFWKVEDGKIVDNWVMVDFPDVLRQLGVDVFAGKGWEIYDRGAAVPPRPDHDK